MVANARRREIEKLFGDVGAGLRAIVASNVAAPDATIEEACQTAWLAYATREHPVDRDAALGWLATTATREALRLHRREARWESLEVRGQQATVLTLPARSPSPARAVELRERLAEVHQLPVRQQRMVWLQGFGYDYNEIAAQTGDSRRTVERQLARARHRLRLAASGDGVD